MGWVGSILNQVGFDSTLYLECWFSIVGGDLKTTVKAW